MNYNEISGCNWYYKNDEIEVLTAKMQFKLHVHIHQNRILKLLSRCVFGLLTLAEP